MLHGVVCEVHILCTSSLKAVLCADFKLSHVVDSKPKIKEQIFTSGIT